MKREPLKIIGVVLAIGAVIAIVCMCSALGGFGNLFGGGRDVPVTGNEGGNLGRMYTASQVDSEGCPVQRTTRFSAGEPIYIGVERSRIPSGATMFVRLYYQNRVIEDAPQIQADRDMDTCVWFLFEPSGLSAFEPGNYEAELIVNGNVADSITFQVSQSGTGSNTLPGTGPLGGSQGRVELGEMYASSAVDQTGCPLDSVSEFYSNETIYISYTESYIPSGTEMFARLIFEGRTLEETAPIYADRDLEACVWFVFETGRTAGGFQPGRYQAEVFVDGNRADTIQFSVR
jgi:hypothetical protein